MWPRVRNTETLDSRPTEYSVKNFSPEKLFVSAEYRDLTINKLTYSTECDILAINDCCLYLVMVVTYSNLACLKLYTEQKCFVNGILQTRNNFFIAQAMAPEQPCNA